MNICKNHKDRTAVYVCEECKEHFCSDCIYEKNKKNYCSECIKKIKPRYWGKLVDFIFEIIGHT